MNIFCFMSTNKKAWKIKISKWCKSYNTQGHWEKMSGHETGQEKKGM